MKSAPAAITPDILMVDTSRIQYVAIAGSILLLLLIFELARKGRIRIQYSVLWFFVGGLFLTFSIWRDGLDTIARLLGVAYPPAALFLVLIIGVIGILIHFSVVVSRLSERTRALVQETGVLSLEVRRLKEKAGSPGAGEIHPGKDHEP
jgi:hypothetical protein